MAYNQPLALGLAIGIPCFLVLLACGILVMRHRRVQKREDKAHDDVELDNDSFKGFEQALHQPYGQVHKSQEHVAPHTEKMSSLDTNLSRSNSRSSNSRSQTSFGAAEETTASPFGSESSVAMGSSSNIPSKTRPARDHKKSGSVYDFYDSFIPIAQPGEANRSSGAGTDLPQPPTIASERQSIHSQNNSLIGVNKLDRSLDSLAKQLQSHQFDEKFPTKRGMSGASPRKPLSANQTFDSEEWSPSKEPRMAQFTIADQNPKAHPYRAKAVEGKPSLSLQDNFDNNITADADFDDVPAVVFK